MRDLGQLWQYYQNNPQLNWAYEKRIIIDGQTYKEEEIRSFSKSVVLFDKDLTIGKCVSARFDVTVDRKPDIEIARNAEVIFQMRIVNLDTLNAVLLIDKANRRIVDRTDRQIFVRRNPFGQVELIQANENYAGHTDWYTFGIFHIDKREQEKNILKLECYDKMRFTDGIEFLSDGEITDDYPMSAEKALQRITQTIGIEPDPRNVYDKDAYINYPNLLTLREVLGFIASLHGGNFYITDDGKLRLITAENSSPLFFITDGSMKKKTESDRRIFDKLYFQYSDDGDCYEAGTGEISLEITNLFATQEITDKVQAKISGYIYNSVDLSGVDIDPSLEIGDSIDVNGIQCNIWSYKMNSRIFFDLQSPTIGDTSREFAYQGMVSSILKRKVSFESEYYGTSISRTQGLNIQREDGRAGVLFNADIFRSTYDNTDKVLFDFRNGIYKFEGELGVNTMIAGRQASLNLTIDGINTKISDNTGYISNVEQTANKINWMVSSGTSATNFTITDRMFELTGQVVFNALASSGQTTINGNNLNTGTIYADIVNVANLSATNITRGDINMNNVRLTNLPENRLIVSNSSGHLTASGGITVDGFSYIYPTTNNGGSIGRNENRFGAGYFLNVNITSSLTVGGYLGFFGASPTSKKSLSLRQSMITTDVLGNNVYGSWGTYPVYAYTMDNTLAINQILEALAAYGILSYSYYQTVNP